MHRLIVAAVGLLMVAAPGWALALGGGEAGDLQAARLNALAGGPLSERDKGVKVERQLPSASALLTRGTTIVRADTRNEFQEGS